MAEVQQVDSGKPFLALLVLVVVLAVVALGYIFWSPAILWTVGIIGTFFMFVLFLLFGGS